MALINQKLAEGVHTYYLDAAGLNGGAYFYKLEVINNNGSNFTDIKKMTLLK